MPYLKIWIHLVWSTKNREHFLTQQIRQKVFKHMRDNANTKGIYLDFINGYTDHVHCLVSLKSEQTISKIIQLLKGESSYWINQNKMTSVQFEWQNDYFAASVSHSHINRVREYIKNQESHHKKQSFIQEYDQFLDKYGFVKYRDADELHRD